jgi:hypothetical protein
MSAGRRSKRAGFNRVLRKLFDEVLSPVSKVTALSSPIAETHCTPKSARHADLETMNICTSHAAVIKSPLDRNFDSRFESGSSRKSFLKFSEEVKILC